jgi:poly(A) polymerase
MNAALSAAREALAGAEAWVVGGALRDELLGRETDDVDLVARGDVAELARRLAREARASAFALSDAFGAWRVTARDRSWQADLMPLEGDALEDDLARRDFTVNAMARPLAGGELVDPFGGRGDLAAPRLGEVPGERAFGELKLIVTGEGPVAGLLALDSVGALEAVLPELTAQRGIPQNRYHHLDVHDHTLEVLARAVALERDPAPLGAQGPAALAVLSEPLADDLTRAQALRFGALLHDAAKPHTRGETTEGRVTFMGHDARGAELARAALGRLRASQRLREHVAALTLHHLRAGFLVHRRPLSRRDVHAYLRACEPVEVDVTVLSVADRLATRGDRADEAIANHLGVARELLGEALRWRAGGPPRPLVRGDQLTAELGLRPGPQIGRLLRELEAAQFAGEIASSQDAVALARRLAGQSTRDL